MSEVASHRSANGAAPEPETGSAERDVLRVTDLVVGYGENIVIDGVSINVRPGEVVAILGGNGSGKTTLMKAIVGELASVGGSIEIAGVPVVSERDHRRSRWVVSYVPQLDSVFTALSVHENLQIGAYRFRSRERARRCEELFELFPALKQYRRTRTELLSGGERRLVGVARALAANPQVFIMDEPTANLSPKNARQVLGQCVAAAAKRGTGVLLVEQRIREALSVASRVYVLANGKVAMAGDAGWVSEQPEFAQLVVGRRRHRD